MQKAFENVLQNFDRYYRSYVALAIQDIEKLKAQDPSKINIEYKDLKWFQTQSITFNQPKYSQIYIITLDEDGVDRRIIYDPKSQDDLKSEVTMGKVGVTPAQDAIDKYGRYFTDKKYSGMCDLRAFERLVDAQTKILRCDPDRLSDLDLNFDADSLQLNVPADSNLQITKWDDTDVNYWVCMEIFKSCPEILQILQEKIDKWEATNSAAESEIKAHQTLLDALSNNLDQENLKNLKDACKISDDAQLDQSNVKNLKSCFEHLLRRFNITMPLAPVISTLIFENDAFSKCETSLPSVLTVYPYLIASSMNDMHIPFHGQMKPKHLLDALFHLKSMGEIEKRTIKVDKWAYLPRYLLITIDRFRKDPDAVPVDNSQQIVHVDNVGITIPTTITVSEGNKTKAKQKSAAEDVIWDIMLPATRGDGSKLIQFDLNLIVAIHSDTDHVIYRRNKVSRKWWIYSGSHGTKATLAETASPDSIAKITENAVLCLYKISDAKIYAKPTAWTAAKSQPGKTFSRSPKSYPRPPPSPKNPIIITSTKSINLDDLTHFRNAQNSCWYASLCQFLFCIDEVQSVHVEDDPNKLSDNQKMVWAMLILLQAMYSGSVPRTIYQNTIISDTYNLTYAQNYDIVQDHNVHLKKEKNYQQASEDTLNSFIENDPFKKLFSVRELLVNTCAVTKKETSRSTHEYLIVPIQLAETVQMAFDNAEETQTIEDKNCPAIKDGSHPTIQETIHYPLGKYLILRVQNRVLFENNKQIYQPDIMLIDRTLKVPVHDPSTKSTEYTVIGCLLFYPGHYLFAKYIEDSIWILFDDSKPRPKFVNDDIVHERCLLILYRKSAE